MAIRTFSPSDIRSPSAPLGSVFTCDLSGVQPAAVSRSNLSRCPSAAIIFPCGSSLARAFLLALPRSQQRGLDSPSFTLGSVVMASSSANSLTLSASMNEYLGGGERDSLEVLRLT